LPDAPGVEPIWDEEWIHLQANTEACSGCPTSGCYGITCNNCYTSIPNALNFYGGTGYYVAQWNNLMGRCYAFDDVVIDSRTVTHPNTGEIINYDVKQYFLDPCNPYPGPPCIPETCASLGYNCGIWDDGCGNPLNCGSCEFCKTCDSGVSCIPDPTKVKCDKECCPSGFICCDDAAWGVGEGMCCDPKEDYTCGHTAIYNWCDKIKCKGGEISNTAF